MILIAESGSTKTEWRIIDKKGNIFSAKSRGINPYYQDSSDILEVIRMGMIEYLEVPFEKVFFYGAGCGATHNKKTISACFEHLFPSAKIEVNHDMLAAARSLCGIDKGIACILGTGSNSCLYDGIGITDNVRSLGYILGDEGSGNYLGKQLLRKFIKKELPKYIREDFDQEFDLQPHDILENVYRHHMPILYLSSFSKFIYKHISDPQMEAMVYDAFKRFVELNILQYQNYKSLPVHFTGSVAYFYQNTLNQVCNDLDVDVAQIEKDPIDGLVHFHSII